VARRRPTSPLLEAIAELAGFPVGGGSRSHRGVVQDGEELEGDEPGRSAARALRG
jgi:hypothetical protein